MVRIEFYSPEDKLFYKINPVAKLFWLISCLLCALLIMDLRMLLLLFLSILFILFIGVPLQKVKISLIITIPIVMFAVFYPFVVRAGNPLYYVDWPWYHWLVITDEGLILGITAMLRTYMIALVAFIFWITTSPEDMTRGFERLGLPAKFAVMFSMALNFVPSMLDKLFSILEAQKARGSEIGQGRFMGKIKSFARVSTPLMYYTLERAQIVSLLLAARGFGLYKKRTYLHEFYVRKSDYVLLIIYIGILVISLILGYGFHILRTTF